MHEQNVHALALQTAATLSSYYDVGLSTPQAVIRILNAENVRFMLIGAYAIAGWTREPRATQDVDVLVAIRGVKGAVAVLLAAFPHLRAENDEILTSLRDSRTGKIVIDVMKPRPALYRDALKHAHRVKSEGPAYLIPSLELALAMRFSDVIRPTREEYKKYYDAGDFIRIVKGNPNIDLQKLHTLGQLVYNGGGAEVVEKVRWVRAGERMRL